MNAKIENAKMKLCAVADKVSNSKVYKAVERGAVTTSAVISSLGLMGITSSAAEIDNTLQNAISVDTAEILNMTQPFMTPAITVLCCVGGIKLGMRFLKGSMN